MKSRQSNKLFRGKYQHKVVLVCAGASYFRSGDMDATAKSLQSVNLSNAKETLRRNHIKTQGDLDYALALCKKIKNLSDCEVRVESPLVTVYVNTEKEALSLANIDIDRAKYICSPPSGVTLAPGTIVMSKCDFEFKVTLGRTNSEHSAFIQWAESNPTKVKLTGSCKRNLLKPVYYGGAHFYLTGDNVLLMAKMHLGGSIAKIERITKK